MMGEAWWEVRPGAKAGSGNVGGGNGEVRKGEWIDLQGA